MVRPDLRRDMAGIPEISGPQEREKCGTQHPEEMSSPQGCPQSLVGNSVPKDESEL
jgi:hypothetical protein